MKQITMDWDTYQSELAINKDTYDEGFEKGSQACQERLEPILNYLRDALNGNNPGDLLDLRQLMKEAGEL